MFLDMTEKQCDDNDGCELNPAHKMVFGVAVGSPSQV